LKKHGRILLDTPNDANLGLAIDHALLLQHLKGESIAIIRLWNNPSSVIIGRGQSLEHEVNQEFCKEKNIQICRRISGGGTVYQDHGNLNISLIYQRRVLEKPEDIKEATRLLPNIIRESLEKNGFEKLTLDNMNSIHINGSKISGAASYLKRDVILTHSTLLLSANLEYLEKSLLHFKRERLGSRYSPTRNLLNLNVDEWKSYLIQLLEERFDAPFKEDNLTSDESRLAERLRETIYNQENWILKGEYTNNIA
jgi:lipoate---protein ligase